MVHDEIPAWCAARGFDTSRLAAWGWSMGGYGSLLLAATFPGFVRAVAAFAPAVSGDVPDVAELRKIPIGLWCGKQDGYYDDVRELAGQVRPVAGGYADGRHNFGYWSRCIPDALAFLAGELS
jgi:S-formylglutathione hydrolase FrmB